MLGELALTPPIALCEPPFLGLRAETPSRLAFPGTITIALGAGFFVNKQLTIDGSGQSVTIDAGNTTGTVFDFTSTTSPLSSSSGSILRNVTVQGATPANSPLIAVYVPNVTIGPGVTIQNNTSTGGVGVAVASGGSAILTGAGGGPVVVSGNAGSGVYVNGGGALTVNQNVTIQNNGSDGIGIAAGTGAVTIAGMQSALCHCAETTAGRASTCFATA